MTENHLWPEATWTSDKHKISHKLQMIMGLCLFICFCLTLSLIALLIGGLVGTYTTLLSFALLFTFADVTIHFKTFNIKKNRWTIKIGQDIETKSPNQ